MSGPAHWLPSSSATASLRNMQVPCCALEPSSLAAALPLGLGGAVRLRRPRSGQQQRAWRTAHAGAAGSRAASSTAGDGQATTPLVDAVRERGDRSGDVPFHVPGHKRGSSTPGPLRQLGLPLQYDLTELEGLDYLASPTGVIAEAQALAAELWGAEASWFLVNGTTVGIHAAVMATCGPGDTLLLARNAHLSAFNAMVLAGCSPLYVQPRYDPAFGVAHHVTVEAVAAALREARAAGRRVGAVLVVSPTYFGVASDIAGLAAECHRHGVPLIVDEAHGAHLGLAPGLPPSALQQGADVVVQSTHKQLSAMTQAAMLHMGRGARVSRTKLARALQVLQSSSPSYILMSSLDAARAQAADPDAFSEPLAAAALARRRLQQLPGVAVLSEEHVLLQQNGSAVGSRREPTLQSSSRVQASAAAAQDAVAPGPAAVADRWPGAAAGVQLDPLRLTVSFQGLGLSGYEAAEALEQGSGIVPELSTHSCVVLAMSIGSTLRHAAALVAAVEGMCAAAAPPQGPAGRAAAGGGGAADTAAAAAAEWEGGAVPPPAVTPRDAYFAATECVPVAQAVGRVSAELVCPYPPGVPSLFPGEAITEETHALLRAARASGGRIAGCADPSLQNLEVLKLQ